MPTALIIGAASQDGYYLARFLLSKHYQVIGTLRRGESSDVPQLVPEFADLLDYSSLSAVIEKYHPAEIYNLAALSLPLESWSQASLTAQVNGIGPVLIMEAIKAGSPASRFFQASSREILNPQNPYAAAKLYAHNMVHIYRNTHHLFTVSGILFNHESPRRPASFVTRKITLAAACIKEHISNVDVLNSNGKLELWDLASPRDRGYAGDYVEAMWLMLQNKVPKDYQIATGVVRSVKDIVEIAFSTVGLNWQDYVVVKHPDHLALSPDSAPGDYSEIKSDLGWSPKTSFKDLIEMMVKSDLQISR